MARTQLIRTLGYIPTTPRIYSALTTAAPAPAPFLATKEVHHE
ncbi:hypothetical protein [Parasutterella excrementihominis]